MRLQRLSFLFMNDLVYLYWHAIKKKNYFNILYYSNHDKCSATSSKKENRNIKNYSSD